MSRTRRHNLEDSPEERCALSVAAFPEDRGQRVRGAATMWYLARDAAALPRGKSFVWLSIGNQGRTYLATRDHYKDLTWGVTPMRPNTQCCKPSFGDRKTNLGRRNDFKIFPRALENYFLGLKKGIRRPPNRKKGISAEWGTFEGSILDPKMNQKLFSWKLAKVS